MNLYQYHYLASEKVDREIGCTYTYINGQSWEPHLHDHDYYEFFLTLSHVIHYVNGCYQELPSGTLVFIRPQDCHTFTFRKDIPNSLINLTFTAQTMDTLFAYLTSAFPSDELRKTDMPPCAKLSDAETTVLMKKVSRLFSEPQSVEKRILDARMLLIQMLIDYFTTYQSRPQESVPKWLTRLCHEMQREENFIAGLPRLIALSQKNRAYLGRQMKLFFNMTPTEYINSLRVSYAANLLLETSEEITDICFASGFNCYSCFYSCFIKKYQMSPIEFRRAFRDE